jgi:predicted Zn finger-like uncharacterized protein
VEVACRECGTVLRVNPRLDGVAVRCPRCNAEIRVKAPRQAAPPAAPSPPPPPPPRRLEPTPEAAPARRDAYSLWLFLAQTVLVGLGVACIAGVLFRDRWRPPVESFLHEPELPLLAAGAGFVLLGAFARAFPVAMTLLGALGAMTALAWQYREGRPVDASRTLALAAAMLALWLALQHRRAIR